jgi:hypothetical protein
VSTILKALRRLEDQKAEAAPRPLRDEVVLAPSRARRRSQWIAIVLGAAIAAAAAGGIALESVRRATPRDVAVVAPAAVAPAPGPAPIPAEPAASVAAAPKASPTAPAAGASVAAAPGLGPAGGTAAGAPPAAGVRTAAEPEAFAIVRPGGATERSLPPPQGLPVIREAERASPPADVPRAPVSPPWVDDPADAEPAPPPDERVARAADDGPIRVQRTQWHPSPERRLAWVEVRGATALREVHEGERIGDYVVREIQPAAVVFSDGTSELRREVGP